MKNRPARLERALTQRIKRGFGKKSWGRRKRKLYSIHRKEKIEIDTLVYGVLVMAVVDEVGRVADIWFYPANKHEGKGLKERLSQSRYLRKLFEKYNVLADRGYRGVDGVEICPSKELKSIRQRVKCVFSKMKFLELSGWRNFIFFACLPFCFYCRFLLPLISLPAYYNLLDN